MQKFYTSSNTIDSQGQLQTLAESKENKTKPGSQRRRNQVKNVSSSQAVITDMGNLVQVAEVYTGSGSPQQKANVKRALLSQ